MHAAFRPFRLKGSCFDVTNISGLLCYKFVDNGVFNNFLIILFLNILSFQEKDKEKKDKEKDAKEKEKKVINGHQFTPVGSVQGSQCSQCNKALNSKEAFHCTRKYLYPVDFCLVLFFFLSTKSSFIFCLEVCNRMALSCGT